MMKSKMMSSGGAMKTKMMSSGGAMKTKIMSSGGAMPMKDGKPAFLNDGKGMAKGGMPPALAKHAAMKASKAHAGLKSGGMALSKMGSVKSSSSRDGVASKGKTKGTMVKMAKGGRYC